MIMHALHGAYHAALSPWKREAPFFHHTAGSLMPWHLPRLLVRIFLQAVGFSLVPLMTSVWALTALYFVICFSYNFTNSAVFTSLGWMFPKRAGGALNLVGLLAQSRRWSRWVPMDTHNCLEAG